jgi:hypothetical protein
MIHYKPGVSIRGLKPEMLIGLDLAEWAYGQAGAECIVTSATDGEHKADSLHYVGLAVDLRTHHVAPSKQAALLARLRDVLEPLGFELILEDEHGPNEHLHVEHDPDHTNR